MILNSSPATWPGVPMPGEPKLILPGLALAWAASSATVLAGTEGLTTITKGRLMRPATSVMSRRNTKLSLSYRVALIVFDELTMRSVYPSAGARTTASVPMLLPLPGRFSTTNCWPSRSESHGAMSRARMSGAPAGPVGAMMRTGREGYACAPAIRESTGSAAAPAARCRRLLRGSFILHLPFASHHSITSSAVLMLITNSSGVVLSKAFEQDFSVHQIGRVKPLVKPTIERGQQVETLPCSSLQPPESRQTGRRSELPDLSSLLARHLKRFEIRSFCIPLRIGSATQEQDITLQPEQSRLIEALAGFVHDDEPLSQGSQPRVGLVASGVCLREY